MPRTRSTALI